MQVPDLIKVALKKSPFENHYFCMHENMRQSLNRVAEGKDSYSSYHYSMLINDLEITLKGFLLLKREAGEWKEPHANFLTEDHKLFKLIDQVQKFVPIFNYSTQKEWDELKRFLSNLGRQYTTARYSIAVSFEDFMELNRDFCEPIIEKICTSLEKKEQKIDEFSLGL